MSLYTSLRAPVPVTIQGSATYPANASAGSILWVSFVPNPLMPSTTEQVRVVPASEDHLLYDIYITDVDSSGNPSVTVDGSLRFFVNDIDSGITVAPLRALNLNLRNKKRLTSPVPLNRNFKYQIALIPNANNGSTALTQTIYFKYLRVPADYVGPIVLPD